MRKKIFSSSESPFLKILFSGKITGISGKVKSEIRKPQFFEGGIHKKNKTFFEFEISDKTVYSISGKRKV